MTDLIFPIAFIILIVIGAIGLNKKEEQKSKDDATEDLIDKLVKEAVEMLENLSYGACGTGTNGKALESVENAVRNCDTGSAGAREIAKGFICEWLMHDKKRDHKAIGEYFDKCTDTGVMFEAILYAKDRDTKERSFLGLWEREMRTIAEKTGRIDDNVIRTLFDTKVRELSLKDRLMIMGETVYARSIGLGPVEAVMWQKGCIEEIQIGMSGSTKEHYDYRELMEERTKKTKRYSRDSVHVMIGGTTVRLSFLRFGSDAEMIRVLKNLIKNTGAPELTQKTPRVVCDTEDGRRVTVSRPPFSDSWAGLVRKFDAVSVTGLETLVEDKRLRDLLKKMIREKRSIAITGETASGKTTLLRALLLELGNEKNIRVIESESFELNLREYLPEANILTLKVSDPNEASGVMGFTKKTTGSVFVVGEVNTPEMAVMLTDIAKTSETIIFTAHYRKTSDMVADFTNARLNFGGYSDERMARAEAVGTLQTDIHLKRENGKRFIESISEVMSDGNIGYIWQVQRGDKNGTF